MDSIPYEILEAMVQCFGKAFHYKDGVETFFLTQGIPRPLVDKHKNEVKFVWARRLLTELGESENEKLLQRKVLVALCQLRNVPDPKVADRDAALDAIRRLKALALEHDLISKEEARTVAENANKAKAHLQVVHERAEKLTKLRQTFIDGVMNPDRQAAGYSVQNLLHDQGPRI